MSEPLVKRHLVRSQQLFNVLLDLRVGYILLIQHGFSLLCLVLFGAMVSQARAASLMPTSWWLNAGAVSYHVRADANPINPGLGIDARWSDDLAITAGIVRNSQSSTSRYAALGYTPLHPSLPIVGDVHVGAALGAIDGYTLRGGKALPLAALLVERRWRDVALSVVGIPPVKHTTEGAVVLFVKWRF
jgi:hypothetical protein